MRTPIEKKWKQRKSSVTKKAHEMHWDFGVKVALYIERYGEMVVYQSHEDFTWVSAASRASQVLTPKNFITLAQDESKKQKPQPPSPSDFLEAEIPPTPASTASPLENCGTPMKAPRRSKSQASAYFEISN